MRFNILTIFPHIFDSFLSESILKKASAKHLLDFNVVNIRDFAADKHQTTDDTPYGGGAGMVMMIEPIYRALQSINAQPKTVNKKIVLLSPAGTQFKQSKARSMSKLNEITFICGRYEGIDARVNEFTDEQISVGHYVLNGGEVAAMSIIEAVARLIPGVLGNDESLKEESCSTEIFREYPQYTKPRVFKDKNSTEYPIPDVLVSGNHQKISQWRKKMSK